jgi:uncharacterized protein (TIGR02246 family)
MSAGSSTPSSSEAEIRALIAERVRAVRKKDVDLLMAGYAPDVATFDLVVPIANLGSAAVRKRVVDWFSSFESAIDYDIRDVSLSVSGELAFEHHLTRVSGTTRAGGKVDMWFRETVGYRKIDGRWRVTHQHSSVPFDMADGKARLDLHP